MISERLREGEISVFSLRAQDIEAVKVFLMRARDVQVLRRSDVTY